LPETIDWVPQNDAPRRPRRVFWLLVVLIALIFLGGRTAVSYYVNALWFRSLGYGEVFWKTLGMEWGVFAAFAVCTFAVVYGAFLLLRRVHDSDLPLAHTIYLAGRPVKLSAEPAIRVLALLASLLIAAIAGASMMASWPTLALYRYAPQQGGDTFDPSLASR
jgi:uncharacterized protein